MKKFDTIRLLLPEEAKLRDHLATRKGETRIGETLIWRTENDEWKTARYHILGVCEDAGPRANGGLAGAANAFPAFIKRFLNVQDNRFLSGSSIALHGMVNVVSEKEGLQKVVEDLDELLAEWASEVVASNGIPVVIGGGHNNAYGLIKGCALEYGDPVAVVNLDPHADTRSPEGRHSGNPFTYAALNAFMKKYTVLGLHESYNNTAILDRLDAMNATYSFFEQWLDEPQRFHDDVNEQAALLAGQKTGIELDMDSIAYMPSSAYTPSGITLEQARYYIRKMAASVDAAYLHLPEAAPLGEREEAIAGKALTYLVTDFIKCRSSR